MIIYDKVFLEVGHCDNLECDIINNIEQLKEGFESIQTDC